MQYNILWIDDQYEKMSQISIEAESQDLLLNGFSSFEEGFAELEKNLAYYDAVLLDGMFFEKKGQAVGTEDVLGIGAAIAKLNELKSKKVFPWFVFSGKDQFTKEKNQLLIANKAKCFDKSNEDDVLALFKELKKAAGEQDDIQLKHKYTNALVVCNSKYLGVKHYSQVFTIIREIESFSLPSNSTNWVNSVRKILEALFYSLGNMGIIPESILQNNGWINGSSLFLSNRHNEFCHTTDFIHPMVAENIFRLKNIVQDGSHGEGNLTFRVDDYLKSTDSSYLYKSCAYLLLDILIWFKTFVDEHPSREENLKLWNRKNIESEWLDGKVSRIASNGWGTFNSDADDTEIGIPPNMVAENNLSENDKIRVKTKPNHDGTKTHIKEISSRS